MANEKEYIFNFQQKTHSNLYQHLVEQYIEMYGIDGYYIPLELVTADNIDTVFQEVKQRNYSRIFGMRFIPDDMLVMGGQDIFQKFGYDVGNEITLWITRAEFMERVLGIEKPVIEDVLMENEQPYDDEYKGTEGFDKESMPMIGSLMWVPMWNSMFEISFVEHQENLVLGYRTLYRLSCKKYAIDKSESINVDSQTGDSQELIDVITKVDGIDETPDKTMNIDNPQPNTPPSQDGKDIFNEKTANAATEIKPTTSDDIFGGM
jgi:hypothetical protein